MKSLHSIKPEKAKFSWTDLKDTPILNAASFGTSTTFHIPYPGTYNITYSGMVLEESPIMYWPLNTLGTNVT